MRSLNSTNFEQGNVYIQLWILDPFVGNGKTAPDNVRFNFNLGEIAEDVLKDGRKQYENGLGPDQILVNPRPIWGDVPASQSLIYAFDTNADTRANQDVGLDGLSNSKEGAIYTNTHQIRIQQQMITLIILIPLAELSNVIRTIMV
jgi:cell surface protein SprA